MTASPSPSQPRRIGPADPDEPMTVTLILRPRVAPPDDESIFRDALRPIADRDAPDRRSVERSLAADPVDRARVEAYARKAGLSVVASPDPSREVTVSGKASAVAAAFGVTLSRFQLGDATYRAAATSPRIPEEIAPAVESILGLDGRPVASPRAGGVDTTGGPIADSPLWESPDRPIMMVLGPTPVVGAVPDAAGLARDHPADCGPRRRQAVARGHVRLRLRQGGRGP